jgi:hypothetical protein
MADTDPATVERGYEPDQPHLRGIAIGAGAIVLAVVVAVTIGLLIVRGATGDTTAATDRAPPPLVAGPRLQATPERDLPAFRDEKVRLLHEYGWVDRSQGVVHIPIERAMALLVQQQAAKAATR